MDTRITYAVLAFLVLTAGYVGYTQFSFQPTASEQLESGAELVTLEKQAPGEDTSPATITKIRYTYDGKTFFSFFTPHLRPALDWLRENTPGDTVIAAWWDYGHSIRGYTGRDVIAYAPSAWAKEHTLANPSSYDPDEQGALTGERRMRDLARIFAAPPQRSRQLMQRYNASYLVVSRTDAGKYGSIKQIMTHNASRPNRPRLLRCVQSNGACRQVEQEGQQYLAYRLRSGRFVVPVSEEDGETVVNGTVTYRRGGGERPVARCGGRNSGLSEPVPGCVAISPFDGAEQLLYVPEDDVTATLPQLLSNPGDVEGFTRVYSGRRAQIWEFSP